MIKLDRPECPNPDALRRNNYKDAMNKAALKNAANDKCMYCESVISHIDFAHIEHIKPKARYPEFEFEWNNLGYACPRCNNSKSDKYEQDNPYIDPYKDIPSNFVFASGAILFVRNGSERGEVTIKGIQLNRPDLLEKRLEKIRDIERALTACHRTNSKPLREAAIEELQNEALPEKEYSFITKAFIEAHTQ